MPIEMRSRSGLRYLRRDGEGGPMRELRDQWVRFENLTLADVQRDTELEARKVQAPAPAQQPKAK